MKECRLTAKKTTKVWNPEDNNIDAREKEEEYEKNKMKTIDVISSCNVGGLADDALRHPLLGPAGYGSQALIGGFSVRKLA
jgi:hypothetical protein